MGRSTRGVKGMNISKDKVISLIKVNPESHLLTLVKMVTEKERIFQNLVDKREEVRV